ncbi:MAG TPA: nicotinate phosphoribosyltransferase [Anaerolineae bacterium]|nr:nicotinate phosphoribosyltransferase [Anaerolineae bacterium]
MTQKTRRSVHLGLSEDRADVYFARTQTILQKEGLDPIVTMEIFPSRDGIFCGIKEVLELLATVLPEDAEVWTLDEGESMSEGEIVLRITAPYSSFGLYETAILGILAHESGWATAARECVEAAEGVPIISFGARHVHPDVSARMEYAAIVGGCVTCATSAGAKLAGKAPAGTIPHAMILIFGDTVKATEAFDRHMPPEFPRIALVDTFKDEAEESLRVARAMGDRLWGVRLDTPPERGRVTPALVKEVRARLDQAGFPDVKIFVSGGITPERIRQFIAEGAPVDGYGVGSYISGARPIDFTGDLKVVAGKPLAKRGRIPGITHNPRLKKVALLKFKV